MCQAAGVRCLPTPKSFPLSFVLPCHNDVVGLEEAKEVNRALRLILKIRKMEGETEKQAKKRHCPCEASIYFCRKGADPGNGFNYCFDRQIDGKEVSVFFKRL